MAPQIVTHWPAMPSMAGDCFEYPEQISVRHVEQALGCIIPLLIGQEKILEPPIHTDVIGSNKHRIIQTDAPAAAAPGVAPRGFANMPMSVGR